MLLVLVNPNGFYIWNRQMRVETNAFWYVANVSIFLLCKWHEFEIHRFASLVSDGDGWMRCVRMLSLFRLINYVWFHCKCGNKEAHWSKWSATHRQIHTYTLTAKKKHGPTSGCESNVIELCAVWHGLATIFG